MRVKRCIMRVERCIITLDNHNMCRLCNEPIKTQNESTQKRENERQQVTIGFVFFFQWVEKVTRVSLATQSTVM